MTNCKKCFFYRELRDAWGGTRLCYANFDEQGIHITEEMFKQPCNNFGNFNKAKELWESKEKYQWREFDKDKRTAHYKTTKRIQEEGADMYLTIYIWSEQQHFMGEPLYDFWHEKALVHYKDGTFRTNKFRSIKNGRCGGKI